MVKKTAHGIEAVFKGGHLAVIAGLLVWSSHWLTVCLVDGLQERGRLSFVVWPCFISRLSVWVSPASWPLDLLPPHLCKRLNKYYKFETIKCIRPRSLLCVIPVFTQFWLFTANSYCSFFILFPLECLNPCFILRLSCGFSPLRYSRQKSNFTWANRIPSIIL